jgi:hypothetical protein
LEGVSILAAKKMFSGTESAWNEEIKKERERERKYVGKEKGENPQKILDMGLQSAIFCVPSPCFSLS